MSVIALGSCRVILGSRALVPGLVYRCEAYAWRRQSVDEYLFGIVQSSMCSTNSYVVTLVTRATYLSAAYRSLAPNTNDIPATTDRPLRYSTALPCSLLQTILHKAYILRCPTHSIDLNRSHCRRCVVSLIVALLYVDHN